MNLTISLSVCQFVSVCMYMCVSVNKMSDSVFLHPYKLKQLSLYISVPMEQLRWSAVLSRGIHPAVNFSTRTLFKLFTICWPPSVRKEKGSNPSLAIATFFTCTRRVNTEHSMNSYTAWIVISWTFSFSSQEKNSLKLILKWHTGIIDRIRHQPALPVVSVPSDSCRVQDLFSKSNCLPAFNWRPRNL